MRFNSSFKEISKIVITWRWPLLAETCSYFFTTKYHHKTYYHSCVSWLKYTSTLVYLHTTWMTHLRITDFHIVHSVRCKWCTNPLSTNKYTFLLLRISFLTSSYKFQLNCYYLGADVILLKLTAIKWSIMITFDRNHPVVYLTKIISCNILHYYKT